MASMSIAAATTHAEAATDRSALTTKGYVDDGLQYVYDAIKDDVGTVQSSITTLQSGVNSLQSAVGTAGTQGTPGTGLLGDVEALQSAIGEASDQSGPGTGLTGAVETLQNTIGNTALTTDTKNITGAINELNSAINSLESATHEYIEGTGIDITTNAQGKNVVGLDLPNNPSEGSYVYQVDSTGNGAWGKMAVETTWDSSVITTH